MVINKIFKNHLERTFNGNDDYEKFIVDLDSPKDQNSMTYIIGYPSGEVIYIKNGLINKLKQAGVIYFERKWDKYMYIDEHKNQIEKLIFTDSRKLAGSPIEDFLIGGCELRYGDFKICQDGTSDIYTSIDLSGLDLKSFPISFGIIDGDFDCSDNNLQNLVNSPYLVEGRFICRDNKLYTLEKGPIATIGYYCQNNNLQDLNGMMLGEGAVEVRVSNNQILDLNFKLLKNIISLSVDGNFIQSLDGISKLNKLEILNCQDNALRTFKDICDIPKLRELYIFDNKLTVLEGLNKMKNLKLLSCGGNKLSNLDGIEDIEGLVGIYCENNNFSFKYKEWLRGYCEEKKIRNKI